MKLQFEAEALIEYQDAAQYAEAHFGSGAEFVLAMRAALDSIAMGPPAFSRSAKGFESSASSVIHTTCSISSMIPKPRLPSYAVAPHKAAAELLACQTSVRPQGNPEPRKHAEEARGIALPWTRGSQR